MLAGGETTDQHSTRRASKWLSLRAAALVLTVFVLLAVPIGLQIQNLLVAESTWPGTVGASIYRQGHSYSQRLAAIDRQDALGWIAAVTVVALEKGSTATAFEIRLRDRRGQPVVAEEPAATLVHPLQESLDTGPIEAEIVNTGHYRVQFHRPKPGKWRLQFVARASDGTPFRRDFEVRIPVR